MHCECRSSVLKSIFHRQGIALCKHILCSRPRSVVIRELDIAGVYAISQKTWTLCVSSVSLRVLVSTIVAGFWAIVFGVVAIFFPAWCVPTFWFSLSGQICRYRVPVFLGHVPSSFAPVLPRGITHAYCVHVAHSPPRRAEEAARFSALC